VTLVNFGLFAFEKLRTDKLSKLLFTNSPSKPETKSLPTFDIWGANETFQIFPPSTSRQHQHGSDNINFTDHCDASDVTLRCFRRHTAILQTSHCEG